MFDSKLPTDTLNNVDDSNLGIGDWFEFKSDDGSSTYAKLGWKSRATGKLVFLNGKNIKVQTMSIEDFAAQLDNGSIQPLTSEDTLERSIDLLKKSARGSFKITRGKSFRLSEFK